ncbi:MAG: Xaa-Pro peptidase family protein [Gammaproteobacteria bacterium]|nr:Xaa-Pro peptidase family protein [Gammaproteobacteria bacterium]
MFEKRLDDLRARLKDSGIEAGIITDDDNVYYLTGYYDYLHMEFGRPTILIVPVDGESLLVTPRIDLNTARATAEVDRIEAWNDGQGNEWREHLPGALKGRSRVAVESRFIPQVVREFVSGVVNGGPLTDITPILSTMRMVKSEEELELARHAGKVATTMMKAGREAIGDGVPEYEVALAASAAGTKTASRILEQHYPSSPYMSPNTHFLQIMASGDEITMTHHRASTRVMGYGEPVFLCFCGMTNFHRFKLGFDRTFWIGEIRDPSQASIYNIAVESQAAALQVLRPGVTAEEVHAAYAQVIEEAGYDYPFRCGRGTGFSFLEKPELVSHDKTVLQPNMVLAVDGSVCTDDFRAQVGDSVIVTDQGYETLTAFPKAIEEVVIHTPGS